MLKFRSARNTLRSTSLRPPPAPVAAVAPDAAGMAAPAVGRTRPRRLHGQALPLLALMLVVLIAFTGLALDVSMLVLRSLQQQRAADAAVLAGVIRLPEDENAAKALAQNYAGLNGYTDASPGYPQVTAYKVPGYNTRLHVDIVAVHPLYFMRIFGIQDWTITRSAEAQYAQPVHLGCPECSTYGVGNTVPITNSAGCPNCILTMNNFNTQQRFWNAINGPATGYADGDAYNAKYNLSGGYQGGCPGTVVNSLNPDYRGSGQGGGYNYGIHINLQYIGDLSLYVYDPARYFRQGVNGTILDTGDSGSSCPPPPANDPHNYYTIFRLYDTHQTPEDYSDDTLLWESTHYIDNGNPSLHDTWMLLHDIPRSWVTQYGDVRLQVVTNDFSSAEGVGRNQFALALGGPNRRPNQGEAIYAIGNISTYLNLSAPNPSATPAPTTVGFYLANITREHAGEQMGIRVFDLGDAQCDVTVQVLKQDISNPNCGPTDDCYQPYPFQINWTGPLVYSLPVTINCSSGTCQRLFNGLWVTLGVALPLPAVYNDTWWKIGYTVGRCAPGQVGVGVFDRTTWDVQMIGNPIHLVH